MKKILFILLLLFNISFAQMSTSFIDYTYKHKADTIDKTKLSKANFRLLFDSKSMKCYNIDDLNNLNKLRESFAKQNPNSGFDNNEKITPKSFTSFMYDNPLNNYFEKVNDIYYLEERKFVYDWKLTDDKKVYMSRECQKAIGNFKGREYEVWFTTEIPYPIGPWKLGGLPGAILYAKDKTGDVEFEAYAVNTNYTEETLELPTQFYKVTKEKLEVLKEEYLNNLSSNLKVTARHADGTEFTPKRKIKTKPNNPIELKE